MKCLNTTPAKARAAAVMASHAIKQDLRKLLESAKFILVIITHVRRQSRQDGDDS
jgi:hypothetical protein